MLYSRFTTLRALIVLVLGLTLSACSQTPQTGMGMDHAAAGHTTTDPKAPFDKAFIDAMIPHHESAIEAAKIAQQRATKPEIKQLAGDILTAQEREIAQMREWRKAWYGG